MNEISLKNGSHVKKGNIFCVFASGSKSSKRSFENMSQFHQRFTRAFFVRNSGAKNLNAGFGFGAKISAQNVDEIDS